MSPAAAQGCRESKRRLFSVDRLLREVLVVDELPDVLRDGLVFLQHHPVVIVRVQLHAEIGNPFLQAAEVTGEDRRVFHPPDHERRRLDDRGLRTGGHGRIGA